jgi:opacity protein-like surface antigen
MKRILPLLLALLFIAPVLQAQEEKEDTTIKIVTEEKKPEPRTFLAIRPGLWFPKDKEKDYSLPTLPEDVNPGEINQSQALGLDFHWRTKMNAPMYFDASLGGWFSTYEQKFTELGQGTVADNVTSLNTWVAIAPVTIGLSVAPVPGGPIQPYAMAGLGVYVGITGRDGQQALGIDEDTKVYGRFGFYFGAGVDFLLGESIGVSVGAKYQFVKFQYPMYTAQQDFSGLQVMLGLVLVN